VVTLGSAVFHLLISLLVWLFFYLIFFGVPHVTILMLPLELLPLGLLTLGVGWLLASLSVYLRDVAQVIGVMTTVLMFLTPIFYPLEALPEKYRPFLHINPMTHIIVEARDMMLWGKVIDWRIWAFTLVLSLLTAWFGFAWFQKTRKGFADVL
jgi:lipopolysaccharide transport system permease protein